MMDVSAEYIKMCKKAEEIQAIKHPSKLLTTLVVLDDGQKITLSGDYIAEVKDYSNFTRYVWLPCQEDLQEMLFGNMAEQFQRLTDFIAISPFPCSYFGSWEQLWLAFVMKERYGKVWNGEKWVKEKLEG